MGKKLELHLRGPLRITSRSREVHLENFFLTQLTSGTASTSRLNISCNWTLESNFKFAILQLLHRKFMRMHV